MQVYSTSLLYDRRPTVHLSVFVRQSVRPSNSVRSSIPLYVCLYLIQNDSMCVFVCVSVCVVYVGGKQE